MWPYRSAHSHGPGKEVATRGGKHGLEEPVSVMGQIAAAQMGLPLSSDPKQIHLDPLVCVTEFGWNYAFHQVCVHMHGPAIYAAWT